jgi:hypothetical protein
MPGPTIIYPSVENSDGRILAPGSPNTFTIGTVTTLDTGEPATVSITGSAPNYVLNFGLPQGDTGVPSAFEVGSVTTGNPGSDASVTITGSAPNYTLDFSIPQGATGSSGSITLATATSVAVYVDSISGSDANSGVSPTLAKQTLSAAITLASGITGVGSLRIAGGSTFYEPNIDFSALSYWTIERYGQGNRPVIDGTTLLSGTWTQHGTYTNVWYLAATIPATSGNYAATASSAWHPAMWDEAAGTRVEDASVTRCLNDDTVDGVVVAETAINDFLAILDTNPGTFYVHKTGSTEYEPRNTASNGTAFTFYIHTRDSTNPNTNSRSVRVVGGGNVATFGVGQRITDLIMRRNGNKDMISVAGGVLKPEYFHRCDFLEAAVHGMVLGGVECRDCRAEAAYHGDARRDGGGGFHQFRATGTDGKSRGFKLFNVEARGFDKAVYSHSSGSPPTEHISFDVDGLVAVDCNSVLSPGLNEFGVKARRIRAIDCARLGDGAMVVEDSVLFLSGVMTSHYGASETVYLKRCFVYGVTGLLDAFPLGTVSSSSYPTLNLEDSTVYGTISDPGNAQRRQQHWTLLRSYLGVIGLSVISGDIIADATSIVEHTRLSSEDLRSTHAGVELGARTGWRRHVFTKTIVADDISYWNTTRTASYSGTDNGDGTANLTMSFNDRSYGRYIRVIDAYGSGLHYSGRVVSKGATSGDPIVVAPPPSSAFTTKALHAGVFNNQVWKDSVTATLSEDGTQVSVPDGTKVPVGTIFRVSHPVAGRAGFGIRTVTARSGNILTLDAACSWVHPGQTNFFNSVDGVTITGRQSLPTVTLSFGLEVLKRALSGQARPKFNVTPVEGGSDLTGTQATNFLTFTASGEVLTSRDTTGVSLGSYRGVNHEFGYNDTGFSVAVGDVLTIEVDAKIPEDGLTFVTDPEVVRDCLPHPDSLVARRQIGYRPRFNI